MDYALAGEVLDCLAADRRVFRYFKHRYALMLLALAAGRGRSVSELRRSRFGVLLSKPIVRPVARQAELCADELNAIWPASYESYVITLGLWGEPNGGDRRWNQLTRRGVSLVLQLNFSASHDRVYRRLLRMERDDYHPFEWSQHPIHGSRRTLAWVRLDLDLDEGEALIEEVQSDRIREAHWVYEELRREQLQRGTIEGHWLVGDSDRRLSDVERYVYEVLPVHQRMWDEAALAATIEFVVREVGIDEIYYHTWEGGRILKGIPKECPPRSIYEKLPRRFCFERVDRAPRFLRAERGHRFRRQVDRATERHGIWFLTDFRQAPRH